MKKKITLPPAFGICENCLQKQTGNNGLIIATYCLHNAAGGVMQINNGSPAGLWKIYSPISVEDFTSAILGATEDAKKMFTVFDSNEKIKHFKN